MKFLLRTVGDLVTQDSFIFFYYAGHGFEMADRFLMPTDCPDFKDVKQSDVLGELEILQLILDRNPALLVLILDMCLKLPQM